MRRARRSPRRPGVYYGSPRTYSERSEASLFGRLLGPVLIVGAFALLAGGAWAFVGRGGAPAVSPTPTLGAISTPTPTASPSPAPTGTPVASPTPEPTLPPSPSPTEFAIEVREGPGAVTFGRSFDEETLRITDPATTFPRRGRFYWSAQLTEGAGAPQLRITLSQLDIEAGTEALVSEEAWEVDNERATIFLRQQRLRRFVEGPGVYVVRYFRGDILLAEGYFRIE